MVNLRDRKGKKPCLEKRKKRSAREKKKPTSRDLFERSARFAWRKKRPSGMSEERDQYQERDAKVLLMEEKN